MAHIRKQQIAFFLTTRCNLSCRYCYTPKLKVKKEHAKLNLNFAKKGIDDFFRVNSSREIRFYGAGEPTLELGLMEEIRNYAHEQAGDKLKVELQSNGFFSKRASDWIAKNVDILWISCDGPPEIQDFWRPTAIGGKSSNIVESNIKLFATQRNIQTGVRVTITPPLINRQEQIIDYFHELGVKYVCAEPVCAPAHKKLDEKMDTDAIEFAKGFVEAFEKAKNLGMLYMSLLMANFDEETNYACRACTPCPHLTPDGYVSCCDIAQFGPEYSPGPLQQLIYGFYDANKNEIIYDLNSLVFPPTF